VTLKSQLLFFKVLLKYQCPVVKIIKSLFFEGSEESFGRYQRENGETPPCPRVLNASRTRRLERYSNRVCYMMLYL